MDTRGLRFLAAGTALFIGASMVWLAGAVPVVAGAAPGSALSTGPEGLSRFALDLRERGILAQSVRIDDTSDGIGISPLPWHEWGLRPQDSVLSARSNVALTPAELATGKSWLESGGLLVLVAESGAELQIAGQLLGKPVANAKMFDGAFMDSSDHPIVPDGDLLYQLDNASVVAGGEPYLSSAGLAWAVTPTPGGPDALRPFAFAARYPVGSGTILIVGDSHPVSNGGREQLDNALLVARLVEELAKGGGVVYIDEGHRDSGVPLRLDLALRGIDAGGRLAIVAIAVLVLVLFVAGLPGRIMAALRRRLAPPPTVVPDGLDALKQQEPAWDPRILDRLWGEKRP